MSNDTIASLQAQAQDILNRKGSRALALFLIGRSVFQQTGHTIAEYGDSLHLAEAADELQALIETNKPVVYKTALEHFIEEAERVSQPYIEEQKRELEFLHRAFMEDVMGIDLKNPFTEVMGTEHDSPARIERVTELPTEDEKNG